MKTRHPLLIALLPLLLIAAVPEEKPKGGGKGGGNGGVILGSSGHVRVTVNASEAKVDYVRSIVPGVTRADLENGAVDHSYTVRAAQ